MVKLIYPEPLDPKDRDETIKIVKEALASKKLSALHVYRLADEDETNSISAITLKQTLQSLVPEIPAKIAFKLMRILDTNRNGFIDLHEYEIIFLKNKNDLEDIKDNDSRMEYRKSEHQSINNESVIDNNDSIMDDIGTPRDIEKREDVHSDDPSQLTKNIGKVMAENSINPEAVFDEVDQEGNGTAPLMLILRTLTEFMPEVDGVSLFRASKYMDSSKDGFIKRGDFLAALGGKKIERAPQEEKYQRPVIKPASSSVQAPVASQGQKKNQNSGAKTWEEPALLSDRQFYEKVRHLKQLLKAEGVSVDSLFGYDDCKEQAVMSIATRIHECFPKLPKSEIIPILKYVDVGNNGTIQRDEFELMIGYNNKTATIDESQLVTFDFNDSLINQE